METTHQNDLQVPPELVPDSSAAYFSEVARVLYAKIPLDNTHSNSYVNERKSSNFIAHQSTSAEVFEVIMSLHVNLY